MAYDAGEPSPDIERPPTAAACKGHGIGLGLVREVQGCSARVRVGARELALEIDASVDPELVTQAQRRGARVVVDFASSSIVGVLMTARTLELDRRGNLDASVKRLTLRAEETLLATPRAFLRLRAGTSELFSDELVARGRLLTRILGKAIKLN